MADPNQHDRFSDLLQQNYRRLYGYIYSLVRNFSDAEELLQDTSLVLWQKFDEFDPQTNFMTWACQIAKFTVLNFLRKEQRRKSHFTEEFQSHLLSLGAEAEVPPDDIRHDALEHCAGQLSQEQRDMLWDFYSESKTVPQIASERSRRPAGIYGSLHHIRNKLLQCMTRYLDRRSQS